jgi:hypothetical protein
MDHREDLKQTLFPCVVNAADVCLVETVEDGNRSDQSLSREHIDWLRAAVGCPSGNDKPSPAGNRDGCGPPHA